MDIFGYISPRYKIDKEVALYEFFAGYGSTKLGLERANIPHHSAMICEWAINSIQAYKDLHYPNTLDLDYNLSKEELVDLLFNKGVSANYNNPLTKEQLKRYPLDKLKKIWSNIKITNNLVNICNVKGSDLELDPQYCNMFTYSFPCQDLSLAGTRQLMHDTSTRSGLLWEFERILDECKIKPNILLMENVPQVHGVGAIEDFKKWLNKLESLGYSNYWSDLNSKDYGIPQTRNRCFCVSILGDYSYEFPKPFKLEKRLKDLLEDNVDEHYYLSNKQIEDIRKWNAYEKPLDAMKKTDKENISPTLTTRTSEYTSSMILINDKYTNKSLEKITNNNITDDVSGTLTATGMQGVNRDGCQLIPVKNATNQGYLFAKDGDGVDISSRMEYHRGTVQDGMAQTISCCGGENVGVVVKKVTDNYIEWEQKGYHDVDCRAVYEDGYATTTTTTPKSKVLLNDLRIRKLTPRECFRLMGLKDDEIDRISGSDANKYHLAGDSIVVDVLEQIFRKLVRLLHG